MKYREVARKLEALGCQELPRRSAGSHRKWFNPHTTNYRVTKEGRDLNLGNLNLGILRAAIRHLGMGWENFNSI